MKGGSTTCNNINSGHQNKCVQKKRDYLTTIKKKITMPTTA